MVDRIPDVIPAPKPGPLEAVDEVYFFLFKFSKNFNLFNFKQRKKISFQYIFFLSYDHSNHYDN